MLSHGYKIKKENPTILEKQAISIMDLFPLNFPLNC